MQPRALAILLTGLSVAGCAARKIKAELQAVCDEHRDLEHDPSYATIDDWNDRWKTYLWDVSNDPDRAHIAGLMLELQKTDPQSRASVLGAAVAKTGILHCGLVDELDQAMKGHRLPGTR